MAQIDDKDVSAKGDFSNHMTILQQKRIPLWYCRSFSLISLLTMCVSTCAFFCCWEAFFRSEKKSGQRFRFLFWTKLGQLGI